jgi:acid stress-induced BolA-like protein IbaG/YrbA
LLPEEIKGLIEAGLDCESVRVSGDGRHFDATVVSAAFQGKPTITRHRMVYATLGDRFDTDALHALSLKTYTPEQWRDLGT